MFPVLTAAAGASCLILKQIKPSNTGSWSTARTAMTGSSSLTAFSLLEAGACKDSVHLLHPVPLCLYLPEQLVGEFHSQTALAVSSGLCYWVITDANAAWETRCLTRKRCHGAGSKEGHCSWGGGGGLCLFSAVSWHHQHLEKLQRQQLYLQLRNVRPRPSGRKWRREEPVWVKLENEGIVNRK